MQDDYVRNILGKVPCNFQFQEKLVERSKSCQVEGPSTIIAAWALVSSFVAELPIEEISVCAWLLKDIAWAASFWPLAFPAAVTSFLVEGLGLLVTSRHEPWWPVRMHRFALLGWLTSNALWMTSELLLEPREPDEIGLVFPWSTSPAIGPDEAKYELGQMVSRILLIITILSEGLLCALQLSDSELRTCMGLDRLSGEQHWQVYSMLFLVPWMLKDFLWTFELLAPSVLCGCLTFVLLLDYYHRSGERLYVAMIFWVSGNMAWLSAELEYLDRMVSPRRFALVLLGIGFIIAGQNLAQAIRGETQFREKCNDVGESCCLLAPVA